MSYAPCPKCGSNSVSRERRIDGNTRCSACWHTAKSTLWDLEVAKKAVKKAAKKAAKVKTASVPTPKKIKWFAKGGGIAKCGPFETQVEAAKAMMLEPQPGGYGVAEDLRIFPDGVFMWPEET